MIERLLEVNRLHVELAGSRKSGGRTVIHDVSVSVAPGESVGLVGESGSGKSMTLKAIMGLLPDGATRGGEIAFRGEALSAFDRRRWRSFRSQEVSMVHQDPRASTNPLDRLGDFVVEGVVSMGLMSRAEAMERAAELLRDVGIRDAARRLDQYPGELSGGLLQRMMIVMALLPGPRLLLADEPTTALDVTVQSDVAAILVDQVRLRKLGMLFVTHDLDLAAAITDTLAVMYAGVVVERGPSQAVSERPRHPYTAGLLRARPSLTEVRRLEAIPGRPLSAFEVGSGCVFTARCPFAVDECSRDRPVLEPHGDHLVACHRADELRDVLVEGVRA